MMTLIEAFLPKLIGECYQERRSGVLEVKNGSISKCVHFSSGQIVNAFSAQPEDQMEAKLKTWAIFDEQCIAEVKRVAAELNLTFTAALFEMRLVNVEKLSDLRSRQVREIISSICRWHTAECEFHYDQPPQTDNSIIIITERALIEGMRQIDDVETLNNIVGAPETYIKIDEDAPVDRFNFTRQELAVVELLKSGGATIEQLKSGLVSEINVMRTLGALQQAGLLKSGSGAQTLNLSDVFDTFSAMRFCYEVESKIKAINRGASDHEILEVKPDTDPEEINAAYDRMSKHFHPSRQAQCSVYSIDIQTELETIQRRLDEAIENINKPKIESLQERQRAAMEFCYQLESMLNAIQNGATHYQLLELERDATPEQVEAKYQQLSRLFGKERVGEMAAFGLDITNQVAEVMSALDAARSVLCDAGKKSIYDNRLGQQLRRDTGKMHKQTREESSEAKSPELKSVMPPPKAVEPPPSVPPTPPPPAVEEEPEPNNIVTFHSSREITASSLYERSLELYDQNQYETAAALLYKAVEMSPEEAKYWAQLGRVSRQIPGNQYQAEAAYLEACMLDPNEADYWAELGLTYQKFGMNKKAMDVFQRALAIDPEHSIAKRALTALPKVKEKS